MKRAKTTGLLACMIIFTLLLAACGGGGGTNATGITGGTEGFVNETGNPFVGTWESEDSGSEYTYRFNFLASYEYELRYYYDGDYIGDEHGDYSYDPDYLYFETDDYESWNCDYYFSSSTELVLSGSLVLIRQD